jgi:hypothetical protein
VKNVEKSQKKKTAQIFSKTVLFSVPLSTTAENISSEAPSVKPCEPHL